MAYPLEQGCIHQRPLAVLASPGRYVQGPGATHELGRELKRLGLADSVLFIAGGTALPRPHLASRAPAPWPHPCDRSLRRGMQRSGN